LLQNALESDEETEDTSVFEEEDNSTGPTAHLVTTEDDPAPTQEKTPSSITTMLHLEFEIDLLQCITFETAKLLGV